ncbi:MAG: hypothetical protein HYY30_03495 [Chloroflexi bacterium]|nr:hypothetical protein [Chloroflexota bacterium]
MYARKALICGIILVGALVLAAVALYPLEANANSQIGVKVTNIRATPVQVNPIDVLTINTTVANDVAAVDDVTIEMIVRDEFGHPVLEERQTRINISHNDKRTVYWSWRIPDRLNDGSYAIDVNVVGAGGNVLATDTNYAAFEVDKSEYVLSRSQH